MFGPIQELNWYWAAETVNVLPDKAWVVQMEASEAGCNSSTNTVYEKSDPDATWLHGRAVRYGACPRFILLP